MAFTSNLNSKKDYFIFCLDHTGLVKWNKSVGYGNYISPIGIATTSDGNIAFGALTKYDGTNYGQMVMKMDADGSVLWVKTYYFVTVNSSGFSIASTQDGGLLISGAGRVLPNTQTKSFVYKIDSSGSFVWGMRSQDNAKSILSGRVMLAASGDIYLGGHLSHPTDGNTQNFILKLDSGGTVGWMKSYEIAG